MALVLDAGALIALERADPTAWARLRRLQAAGETVRVPTAAVAQVWRSGGRNVRLSRALRGVREVALDSDRARRIGDLLRLSSTADIVDGSVVDAARPGDEILTSDVADIARVAAAIGLRVKLVRV
jgi:hypothetical protein